MGIQNHQEEFRKSSGRIWEKLRTISGKAQDDFEKSSGRFQEKLRTNLRKAQDVF